MTSERVCCHCTRRACVPVFQHYVLSRRDTGDSPVAVGNRIGASIIADGKTDGSCQHHRYKTVEECAKYKYTPVNK